MKIHITGNSGAGKSTFAKALGQAHNLPVFGLDNVVWQPGWVKTPPQKRALLEDELIAKPNWIIEGVSTRVRGAADVIIFLDLPPHFAYARALKRNLPYLFKSRPELPANCPEIKLFTRHFKLVWRFHRETRPTILRDLATNSGLCLHVRTKAERVSALHHQIFKK